MRLSIIVAVCFLGACVTPRSASADQVAITPAPEELTLDSIGSCEANGSSVDLRHMLLFENHSVDIRDGTVTRRVRLHDFTVTVELLGSHSTDVYHIAYDLRGEPDIELKLALIDGVLAVYWRETYQNRQYRQGLYHLEGGRVFAWCEGLGGITTDY